MENKKNKHKCNTCGNFFRYYIKGFREYCRRDCGECLKLKKVVKSDSTCKNWRSNNFRPKLEKKDLVKYIIKASNDLGYLKQLWDEKDLDRC